MFLTKSKKMPKFLNYSKEYFPPIDLESNKFLIAFI